VANGKVLEVSIDALAFGGDGVGRLSDGKAVFVPGTAPGDVARVTLVEDKPRVAFARLEALVTAAPERVTPRCPLADRCGGCTWQHLPVDLQRAWKHRLVAREVARRALGVDEVVAPVVGGAAFGHRTRTRLHLQDGVLGTLPRRSHRVLALQVCPILHPSLEAFALQLFEAVRDGRTGDADVELYVDAEGRRGLLVEPRERAASERQGRAVVEAWERLSGSLGVHSLRVKGAVSQGEPATTALGEVSLGRPLAFEPGVFVQTTREGNALLVGEALKLAGEGGTFAEVYAGVGNFTVHLAERFARGSAAEGNPASVAWLRRNLGGRASVTAHAEGDAATARRLGRLPPADLLLADPPHAGMKPLLPLFQAAAPRRVLLVSCHPMAALRDLEGLVRAGYRLTRLVPVDLFPQTDHLELVAALEPAP
jgi:23S rRNA (uracil1939-C5)-methyltransferase